MIYKYKEKIYDKNKLLKELKIKRLTKDTYYDSIKAEITNFEKIITDYQISVIDFGHQNLRELRINSNLTQEQVSKELEIEYSTYVKIEQKRIVGSVIAWQKIQEYFKVPSEKMWDLIIDKR